MPPKHDAFRIKLGYAKILTMNGLVTEGLALLAELTPEYPAIEYDINLFVLGRDLLGRSKIEDSIKVLRENVSKFPDSYYAHFYLAKAYRQNGDIALARDHCLKTLKLYPEHGGALEILKSLEK
jgi:tetratricopeptide (TPR) repeat protein